MIMVLAMMASLALPAMATNEVVVAVDGEAGNIEVIPQDSYLTCDCARYRFNKFNAIGYNQAGNPQNWSLYNGGAIRLWLQDFGYGPLPAHIGGTGYRYANAPRIVRVVSAEINTGACAIELGLIRQTLPAQVTVAFGANFPDGTVAGGPPAKFYPGSDLREALGIRGFAWETMVLEIELNCGYIAVVELKNNFDPCECDFACSCPDCRWPPCLTCLCTICGFICDPCDDCDDCLTCGDCDCALAGRITLNFPGLQNMIVQYWTTTWNTLADGPYDDYAVLDATGATVVRIVRDGLVYSRNVSVNGIYEINVPIIQLYTRGVPVIGNTLGVVGGGFGSNWVYNGVSANVNPAYNDFTVINNRVNGYEVRLTRTGFFPLSRMTSAGYSDGYEYLYVDLSAYFAYITVPQGVSNVRMQSNGWIVNAAQEGDIIWLIIDHPNYRSGAVTFDYCCLVQHRVEFVVDGHNPLYIECNCEVAITFVRQTGATGVYATTTTTVDIELGQPILAAHVPNYTARTGFYFAGWYKGAYPSWVPYNPVGHIVEGPVTFTARFNLLWHPVTLTVGEGGAATSRVEQIRDGTSIQHVHVFPVGIIPITEPLPGWSFVGWQPSTPLPDSAIYPTGPMEFTAIFELDCVCDFCPGCDECQECSKCLPFIWRKYNGQGGPSNPAFNQSLYDMGAIRVWTYRHQWLANHPSPHYGYGPTPIFERVIYARLETRGGRCAKELGLLHGYTNNHFTVYFGARSADRTPEHNAYSWRYMHVYVETICGGTEWVRLRNNFNPCDCDFACSCPDCLWPPCLECGCPICKFICNPCPDCGECSICSDCLGFRWDAYNNGEGPGAYPSRPHEGHATAGRIRLWPGFGPIAPGNNTIMPMHLVATITAVDQDGECALHLVQVNQIWNNQGFFNMIDVDKNAPWEYIILTITVCKEEYEAILFNANLCACDHCPDCGECSICSDCLDFNFDIFNNGYGPGASPSRPNEQLANAGTIRLWPGFGPIGGLPGNMPLPWRDITAVDQDGNCVLDSLVTMNRQWCDVEGWLDYFVNIDVNKNAPWQSIELTIVVCDTVSHTAVLVNNRLFSLDIFNNGPLGCTSRPNASLAAAGTIRMWTQLNGVLAPIPRPAANTMTAINRETGECAMHLILLRPITGNTVTIIDANKNAPWVFIDFTITVFGQTVTVVLHNETGFCACNNPCDDCGECQDCSYCLEFSLNIFNNGPGGSTSTANASLAAAGRIRLWTQFDGISTALPYPATVSATVGTATGACAMEFVTVNRMWVDGEGWLDYFASIDVNKNAPWQRIYLTIEVCGEEHTVVLVNSRFFSITVFNNGPEGTFSRHNQNLADTGVARMWIYIAGMGTHVPEVFVDSITATIRDGGGCAMHLITATGAWNRPGYFQMINVNKNAMWDFIDLSITVFGQTIDVVFHNAEFVPPSD